MHLSASYTTGPSADFLMAPTGQTDAQAGSVQCMQTLRTNLSPRGSITVKAVSDSVGSGAVLKPCSCLQADAQLPQPMHFLMSINIAFCFGMAISLISLGAAVYARKNSRANFCCTRGSTWK